MTEVEIIDDPAAAEELFAAWDALAVACSQPTTTPAWVLAWWRYLAGPTTMARIVAVRDRGKLIGLAPFAVECSRRYRYDYRLPGAEFGGEFEPLAWPGREWEVAGALAASLPAMQPRPDVIALEGTPFGSLWGVALQEQWPGPIPPYLRTYQVMGAPRVSLGYDSFDAWMADRSANFRSQMRRARRRLMQAGGAVRLTTRATLATDVAALVDLHTRRWSDRGTSALVAAGKGLAPMLEFLGTALLDAGRFQLQVVELQGKPISAQLFLAAGERILFINGGWDPQYPQLIASQLSILSAIEHGIVSGEARTLSLGPGIQPYKLRFSDGNEPVAWRMLLPPTSRLPLTAARLAPVLARYRIRHLAARALSPATVARIRRVKADLDERRAAISRD